MIRLYKKINKFNWRYAFGEITLIFLGITLAIWFNNWNSSSIDNIKEAQYLKNLGEDLKNDLIEYNGLIKTNHEKIRQINLLNNIVEGYEQELNCDSIQKFISNASFINIFIGASTVFEDLESTGNLILIKNNELKRKILKYYEHVKSHKKYENFNTSFHINSIGTFLKKEWNVGSMLRLGNGETEINNNFRIKDCEKTISKVKSIQNKTNLKQELLNHTDFSYILMKMNSSEYKVLKKEASEIVELINKK